MKRGTAIVVTTALVAVAAVLIVVFVLQLSSSSDPSKTHIGDDTFVVGPAKSLANRTPLLFQDLRGKDLNVWVNHTGADPNAGWVTFAAFAAPKCPLQWKPSSHTFVDCHKKTYPPDGGSELAHYTTSVDSKGRVVVDFAA